MTSFAFGNGIRLTPLASFECRTNIQSPQSSPKVQVGVIQSQPKIEV
jgi:hypothetical protein